MSQGSYQVPTGGTISMVAFAAIMNAAYNALATQSSGSSSPANGPANAPQEFQTWFDTTNVNFPVWRVFDGVNWDRFGTLDIAGSDWLPQLGGGTASVASAATVNLSANPQTFITITGTATITSFGSGAAKGEMKLILGGGNFVVQNGANIVCPDGLNINVGVGDSFFAAYNGTGVWTVAGYARASAKDLVFNVEDYGAKGDGTTDNTTAISNCMTAAAAASGSVYFPAGNYLTGVITVPTTLPRIFGESRSGTTITFKRQAYAANTALLSVVSNAVKFQLDTLTIDVNNILFVNTYTIRVTGTDNLRISNVVVFGEAIYGTYISAGDNDVVRDVIYSGTNDGFTACIFADNVGGSLARIRVEDCYFSGVLQFGCDISGAGDSAIVNCSTRNNAGLSFGMVLSQCTSSTISGCRATDTSHEAFQLTDCIHCSITGCTCEWTTSGTDFGISINGTSIKSRFNVVANNTILNSYSSGIAVADWSQYSIIANNTLRDCGVRGTAALINTGQFVAYTTTSGAQCINNHFNGNVSFAESGPTTWGVVEVQAAGATVSGNVFNSNYLVGATTLFSLVSSTSLFLDEVWRNYIPTVTAGSGTITSYTVNSASYRLRGKTVEIQLDITITNVGTGAGTMVVTLPFNATTNGGALSGRENAVTGAFVSGVCSASSVQLWANNSVTILATNNRIVVSGVYQAA